MGTVTVTDPGRLDRHTYVQMTASALWDNLPLVVLAGLIFSLGWVPPFFLFFLGFPGPALLLGLLALPPAWSALLAQEAGVAQGNRPTIATMIRALPRYAGRSIGLGLFFLLPLLAAFLTLPSLAQPVVPLLVWAGLLADGVGFLLGAALSLYAFPLLILYDVSLYLALRNAFLLAGRYMVHTVGLLAMGVLFGLAIIYIHNGLALFLPAVWGLFIVNNCRLVVAIELDESE